LCSNLEPNIEITTKLPNAAWQQKWDDFAIDEGKSAAQNVKRGKGVICRRRVTMTSNVSIESTKCDLNSKEKVSKIFISPE